MEQQQQEVDETKAHHEEESPSKSNKNNEDVVDTEQATSEENGPSSSSSPKRSLNSYYGNKTGLVQTVSLVLNAGLMVYAHVGLSAVIVSSIDPTITSSIEESNTNNINTNNTSSGNNTGLCNNAEDLAAWTENGGTANRPFQSTFCSREYNGGGCFLDNGCIEECFRTEHGYSPQCSACFGAIPACSLLTGCVVPCAQDSTGPACEQCNTPCIEVFHNCTGFPPGEVEVVEEATTTTTGALPEEEEEIEIATTRLEGSDTSVLARNSQSALSSSSSSSALATEACNEYDLESIEEWYTVYNLTFIGSVGDAWNGEAEILAVIVVLFSGIWPYAKNIILLVVWYLPMSVRWQTSIVLWLSRLSKYTLVDVFTVVVVLVGVQLQLDVGGTEAVIRAEPRFGIIAFFLATVWEFVQIELVKAMHEQNLLLEQSNDDIDNIDGNNNSVEQVLEEENHLGGEKQNPKEEGRLLFSNVWIPALLLLVSIGLYVAGACTEIVHFTSSTVNNEEAYCEKSYNLVSLANALINALSLAHNTAAWQTWYLYLVFIVLNLVLPVLVHGLQVLFLVRWAAAKQQPGSSLLGQRRTSLRTVAIWCFACIEVLLIGIFAVEYKFSELVGEIAGETNAGFLDISSGLGPGFYLLIAYSVVAGFLQFSLRIRSS